MKLKIIGILKIAIPAMISSLSGLIAILICTRLLGQADAMNYYLLAVFLPINYVMLAIYESIRSASLTLSTVDAYQGKMDGVSINIVSLVIALLIVFGVFLGLFLCFGKGLGVLIGVISTQQQVFIIFSSAMLASGVVTGIAYIFTSTFFAMKKPLLGMALAIIAALLTCFLTSYFTTFISPTWLSYVLALLIAYTFCSLISLAVMHHYGVSLSFNKKNQFSLVIKKLKPIMQTALPVLFSCLAIFSSLFFVNATLSHFDPAILTGYSIAYRIQNVAILPAITIGTAIAILTSHAKMEGDKQEVKLIQWAGLSFCFLLYLLVAGGIYYFRENLLALVTPNANFIHFGATYLKTVALTYTFMGPNLAYLTALEQSGLGLKSFFINIFYFIFAIGVGCIAAAHYHNYQYLYITIASINGLVFLYVLASSFMRVKLKASCQSKLVEV